MAAGSGHTCIVNEDGEAYCWGQNYDGQLGNAETADDYDDFSEIVAVDTNGVLNGKKLNTISAGAVHTCAVDVEGKIYCWGRGSNGQLGNGTEEDSSVPVAVDTSKISTSKFIKISTGYYHTCALDEEKRIYCWGYGCGIDEDSSIPVAIDMEGILKDKKISFFSNKCVLDEDGRAYCWGRGSNGQLGNGTEEDSLVPVAVDTSGVLNGKKLTSISGGRQYRCALDNEGSVYCWGKSKYGQLGDLKTQESSVPIKVDFNKKGDLYGKKVTEISAGGGACVIDEKKKVYCWGVDDYDYFFNPIPTEIDSGEIENNFSYVSASSDYACAINSDGKAYCWGYGSNGQLGNGETENSNVPIPVDTSGVLSNKKLVAIDAMRSVCTLDDEGKAYCWGYGESGQLGDGEVYDWPSSIPVAVDTGGVLKDKELVDIITGGYSTCALDNEGKVYCWGSGEYGQLGNGSDEKSPVPVTVDISGVLKDKELVDASVGNEHACALDDAGKAYCWGRNSDGQLGNGSGEKSPVPVTVDTSGVLKDKELVDIITGGDSTCALDNEGKAYCWGSGGNGCLGNGEKENSNVPVPVDTSGVLSGKKLITISACSSHICALDNEGKVYCWGSYGLGNGITYDRYDGSSVPVEVFYEIK